MPFWGTRREAFLPKLLLLQKAPIRRCPVAAAEEAARAIELLIEQEGDRRVAIWLRVRLRPEPVTTVAAEYGSSRRQRR